MVYSQGWNGRHVQFSVGSIRLKGCDTPGETTEKSLELGQLVPGHSGGTAGSNDYCLPCGGSDPPGADQVYDLRAAAGDAGIGIAGLLPVGGGCGRSAEKTVQHEFIAGVHLCCMLC